MGGCAGFLKMLLGLLAKKDENMDEYTAEEILKKLAELAKANPDVVKYVSDVVSGAISESGDPDVKIDETDLLGEVFAGAAALKESQEFSEVALDVVRKLAELVVDLVAAQVVGVSAPD